MDSQGEVQGGGGEGVEYVFGEKVVELRQDEERGKVVVRLEKGGEREFDLVIGADGMRSKIRRLAFP